MDDRDFKLLQPKDERLLLFLIVRYLQNTTRPIPVNRVWDCDDLVSLFNDEDRKSLYKSICVKKTLIMIVCTDMMSGTMGCWMT